MHYASLDGIGGNITTEEYILRLEGALDILAVGKAQGEIVSDIEQPLVRLINDLKAGIEGGGDAELLGEICSVY